MKYTGNYGYKQPERTAESDDRADINVLADNWGKLDGKLDKMETAAAKTTESLAAHLANRANPHSVTAGQIGAASLEEVEQRVAVYEAHVQDRDNPHDTTAAQVGAYGIEEANALLEEKVTRGEALGGNRVLVTDNEGNAVTAQVSSSELSALEGVSGNIQEQLEARVLEQEADTRYGQLDNTNTWTGSNKFSAKLFTAALAPIATNNNIGSVTNPYSNVFFHALFGMNGELSFHTRDSLGSNTNVSSVHLTKTTLTSSVPVIAPTPTEDSHVATKKYVDDKVAAGGGNTGKRYTTFVVGHTNSGHTADEVDYLCDGVDDQEEINAALAALPDGGGIVVILEGQYNLNAGVIIPKDNVTLKGVGNSTHLLKDFDRANSSVISCTRQYCKIMNLFINGRTDFEYGIHLSNASYNTVAGNIIVGSYYGLYLSNASYNTITSNTITNNSYGIYINVSCIRNTITGNSVDNNTQRGIHLYSATSNNITGNSANSNAEYGICLNTSTNNTISSNIVNNNNRYGISLSHSTNNTIAGNTTNGNQYGIDLYTASSNTIVGNTATGNSISQIVPGVNNRINQISGNHTSDGSGDPDNHYNLDEVKTNKVWIDEKPIYQKVFSFSFTTSGLSEIPLNTPNISEVIDISGAAWFNKETAWTQINTGPLTSTATEYLVSSWVDVHSDKIQIYRGTKVTRTGGHMILRYTKTTD